MIVCFAPVDAGAADLFRFCVLSSKGLLSRLATHNWFTLKLVALFVSHIKFNHTLFARRGL